MSEVEKEVPRVHENLNHCSTGDLIRVLRHAGATKEAIRAAARLKRLLCEETRQAKVQPPWAVPKDALPLQIVSFDIKEVAD